MPRQHFATTASIEILSVGDAIDEGTYAVHSRFHKAINFVTQEVSAISSDRLISLVTEDVGVGPLNIVVRGLDFHRVHSLLITQNTLCIDNWSVILVNSKRYDSTMDFSQVESENFEKHLDLFETFLLHGSPPKSLAFLLDEARKQDFHPGVEQAIAERIQTGVGEIFHGDVLDGAQMIKGLGFGLTPSGDDFISGLLLGLFLLQNIYGEELSERREDVYRLSVGNNLISNTFLYCAKEGLLTERWKSLISSLLADEEQGINEATQRLLSLGETSGADAAVGFLMTLKKRAIQASM